MQTYTDARLLDTAAAVESLSPTKHVAPNVAANSGDGGLPEGTVGEAGELACLVESIVVESLKTCDSDRGEVAQVRV
jgi:hypothetical protein